ncbi:MAG: hypothetical protein WCX64_02350 [Candidatus Micrarchaeia archaeon]|jgi:hypothetical protein
MELLAPLGLLEIARTIAVFAFALVLPGWLFLRLDPKWGTTGHDKAKGNAPLFLGIVETACASVFFSIVICCIAFVALTFTIGLNFWTALALLAVINASMGYLAWKEGH